MSHIDRFRGRARRVIDPFVEGGERRALIRWTPRSLTSLDVRLLLQKNRDDKTPRGTAMASSTPTSASSPSAPHPLARLPRLPRSSRSPSTQPHERIPPPRPYQHSSSSQSSAAIGSALASSRLLQCPPAESAGQIADDDDAATPPAPSNAKDRQQKRPTWPIPPRFKSWEEAKEWCRDNWTYTKNPPPLSSQPSPSSLRLTPFTPAFGRPSYGSTKNGKPDRSQEPTSKSLHCPAYNKTRCEWRVKVRRQHDGFFTLHYIVQRHTEQCNKEHTMRERGEKRIQRAKRTYSSLWPLEDDEAVTSVADERIDVRKCRTRTLGGASAPTSAHASTSATGAAPTALEGIVGTDAAGRTSQRPVAEARNAFSPMDLEEGEIIDVGASDDQHSQWSSDGGDGEDDDDPPWKSNDGAEFALDPDVEDITDSSGARLSPCTSTVSATTNHSDRHEDKHQRAYERVPRVNSSTSFDDIERRAPWPHGRTLSLSPHVTELYDFKALWLHVRRHISVALPQLSEHEDWFLSKLGQRLDSQPVLFVSQEEMEAKWPLGAGEKILPEADGHASLSRLDVLCRKAVWLLPGEEYCAALKDLRDFLGSSWLFVDFSEAVRGPRLPEQTQTAKKLAILRGCGKSQAGQESTLSHETSVFSWKVHYTVTHVDPSTLKSIDLYAVEDDPTMSGMDVSTLVLLR